MKICFKLIRFFTRKFFDFYWAIINLFWSIKPFKKVNGISNTVFSLGIVTYVARLDEHFIPLLRQVSHLFSDTEIIIAINGYHDESIQLVYLKKMNDLLSDFPNVKCVQYTQPQSLSKLWNDLIKHSSNSKTLIFNDDLQLNNKFRKNLNNSGLLLEDVAIINSSWSHFLISKKIMSQVGWFDERYFGVGFEDHDYEARLVLEGISVPNYVVKGVKNIVFITTDFSYAQSVETVGKKYIKGNEAFFHKKWSISTEPVEGYVWVRILKGYTKLNQGMETPNYEPEIVEKRAISFN